MTGSKGFMLIEVLMASTITLMGMVLIAQSFRLTRQMLVASEERYAASLLLETQLAMVERTGRIDESLKTDPVLGPITWDQDFEEIGADHFGLTQVTLFWGQAPHDQSLKLSTYVWK